MQRILRPAIVLAVLSATALVLIACGSSSSGDKVSSNTDVNTLLDRTFAGGKKITSGKFDFHVTMNIQGGGSFNGPVDVRLAGPFESQGKGKLPKFDMDLSFSGAGQNIKAGAESTGDKAFVGFNGQEYVLSDQIFNQFKQGYEQAAAKSTSNGKQTSLASLGINPKAWLTNPTNAGDGKVGDADVVRITGGVDVGKLLDDLNNALSKASSLGLGAAAGGQLPTKLTAEQKQQVEKAVKNVKVEIDTGKEDAILRRMKIDLNVSDPTGSNSGSAAVTLDVQLLDLNKSQSFPTPENPKPFDQLLGNLQQLLPGLSGLGSGGSSGSSGSSGSGSSSSGSSGASAEKLQKYTDCVNAAGSDVAKAQKCASLLTP